MGSEEAEEMKVDTDIKNKKTKNKTQIIIDRKAKRKKKSPLVKYKID